jgi:hypothetical protein
VKKFFLCFLLGDHDWTCNAGENIPATPAQLKGGVAGFMDYAQMWCRRCGKVYQPR